MSMILFQFVLLAPSPTVSTRLYSTSLHLCLHFIFVNEFISTVFLDSIYMFYIFFLSDLYLFFSFLTSLSIMDSSFIHLTTIIAE